MEKASIVNLFETQKRSVIRLRNSSYKERINKLQRLRKAVEGKYKEDIETALYEDLRKPKVESRLTELYPVIKEIKHAKKELRLWMKDEKVKTPVSLLVSSSLVRKESKGNCLIISPWNFPFNLSICPLVSAIAAGNAAIIKPSEFSPNVSLVIEKLINYVFEPDEVSVVTGGVDTSQILLSLPFDHIFFTGSPKVGKIVMSAAAKHLTSVTLELGGKSPVIVDQSANLNLAAKRIVWGKFLNNGQICISPDYLMVENSIKDEFTRLLIKYIRIFFGESAADSGSYGKIINKQHHNRLKHLINNAESDGAVIEYGGDANMESLHISPTLLSNIKGDSEINHEEIFGPLLPIHGFQNINEVVELINSKPSPLIMYLFSKNKKHIKQVLKETISGGISVNHTIVQFSNSHLPFGGVKNSGIGRSHGKYGFDAFTNKRSVLKQQRFSLTGWLMPPYSKSKQKLVDIVLKWF